MNYGMRQGRRIEVETLDMPKVEKKKRKQWAARWVKLPRHWITALRNTRSVHTYQLAHTILIEAYERGTQELTLSAETTGGMSRATKIRSAQELAEFGLIRLKLEGNKAVKITPLL